MTLYPAAPQSAEFQRRLRKLDELCRTLCRGGTKWHQMSYPEREVLRDARTMLWDVRRAMKDSAYGRRVWGGEVAE